MNLSGLFTSQDTKVPEKYKTMLLFSVIAVIVFGFGSGRSIFGGAGGEEPLAYGEFGEFGKGPPKEGPQKNKKHKHRRKHKRDDYDERRPPDMDPAMNQGADPNMAAGPFGMNPFGFMGGQPQGEPGFGGVKGEIPNVDRPVKDTSNLVD